MRDEKANNATVPVHRLEIQAAAGLPDPLADATRTRLESWAKLIDPGLRTIKVFDIDSPTALSREELGVIAGALVDPVAEVGQWGCLPVAPDHRFVLTVGFLPGVTDSVGATAARAIEDCLGRTWTGKVQSKIAYAFTIADSERLREVAGQVLYNPLIEALSVQATPRATEPNTVAEAASHPEPRVASVALIDADDARLEAISREGTLSLSLDEMKAIQDHFRGLGREPRDAELECIAQTWSEHCKHKIFASPIEYVDPQGESRRVEGLFSTYIRAATEDVRQARVRSRVDGDDGDFLVSVFHDNAGVVRFTERDHLVYKVETHNSPSALDPYGGAMTGIVGVNRDSFGTGLGADLLTNVWGYCLGPSDHADPLPAGLMHPRRIRDGVHAGVIDGGNQSGIPYSRGFELFDRRYVGKPLVYCGTVAAMPVSIDGHPTHEKKTAVGDAIVMVGGRIGKDGIHGATFSSVELDESSPVQAVQIGDPIVQKMMWDFLTEARDRGLYSGMTDNGAGGLSSSIGEMAEATGGARLDLALAPLKYPGLQPWEILISEAQERMSIAVAPERLEEFLDLARRRDVEATVLGEFTDSGRFEVVYGDLTVCELELEFLHDGVPLPTLKAQWDASLCVPEHASNSGLPATAGERLDALLASPNIRCGEAISRAYDHEVKGLSVVKPFVGLDGDVPAAATVMRVRHGRDECVVLGEGIMPFWSALDTHSMATACVDEGVRRVLAAGARFDRISALDNFCWPDPIESAKTPDGRHKLAQLVRCCEGLYAACVGYGVPLISGKDSMKNDAHFDGVKISIPPTLLVSVMGQMDAAPRALSLQPLAEGDLVYLLGNADAAMGGSEWQRQFGGDDLRTPVTDIAGNASRYRRFAELTEAEAIRSAHVCARGGLATALAHMVLAGPFGLDIELSDVADLGADPLLFGEASGRLVFTVSPSLRARVEQAFADQPGALSFIGRVTASSDDAALRIRLDGTELLERSRSRLRTFFHAGTPA